MQGEMQVHGRDGLHVALFRPHTSASELIAHTLEKVGDGTITDPEGVPVTTDSLNLKDGVYTFTPAAASTQGIQYDSIAPSVVHMLRSSCLPNCCSNYSPSIATTQLCA